jgi:DNA transformation protein
VAGRDEFLAHVLELLAPLGRVTARGMFGGYGLYCDGVFFGIVLDNVIYLKVDDRNRGDFERAGCEIFSYARKGKRATLNFYRAPEDALDAPQLMLPWAKSAVGAALRAPAAQWGRKAFTASMKARGSSICGQCPQPGISRNFAPGIPFASSRARAGGVV